MSNYFVRNLTDGIIAVHDNYQEIISLTAASSASDRKPISALALSHPGIQRLWAQGSIAVYADSDYDTLIPRPSSSDKPLAEALQEGALAALITDDNSVIRAAVDERIGAVGNKLVADGITYNGNGTVASSTEGGVLTTYTWNADGTCATETRLGLVKTWSYDGNGNPISSTVTAV